MDYDLIIVGAGPGGATAGIYAKRQGLNVVIIEKGIIGGQLAESPEIENYPGFPHISGMEYGEKIKKHLEHLNVPVILGEVTDIKKNNNLFSVFVYDKEYVSKSIILSTGTKHKHLDAPGEKEFFGKGISYCATCDGFFFKGKEVAVIGGGNSALYYADYLSNIASNVYLIHRRQEFRGEPVLVDKLSKKSNVKLILDSVVDSFKGSNVLESVFVHNVKTNEKKEIKLSGVFISVGEVPNNELAKKLDLELDEKGYIKTNEKQETQVKGIYACGDVCGKGWAQAINASAQGMVAGLESSSYVRKL
jgi:thioredoxin reductase (NADPH)